MCKVPKRTETQNGSLQVPISVVHRQGAVALDGTDALVMYVYGAYGVPSDADFDATRVSLLDR